MSSEDSPRPGRFLRVVTLAWLGFVSVFAVIDHVALSRLDAKVTTANAAVTAWSAVQKRIAALEQSARGDRQALEDLRAADLPQQLSELSTRLTALQAVADGAVSRNEFATLADRLSAIEERLARTRAASSHATLPEVRVVAERESSPPFVVLGAEWRGGEHFLAISSSEARGLGAVRLLRPGDAEGDWHLQALEGDTAVFARAGHIERIHVP